MFLPWVPKFDYQADPDLGIAYYLQQKDLWMLVWMLRSFLTLSKLRPVIVITDDGTLDKATEKINSNKFSNVKIMFKDETTKRIMAMPDVPEIIKKARRECHFFLDKLINPVVFSKAKKLSLPIRTFFL